MINVSSLSPIERWGGPEPTLGFDMEEDGYARYFEEDYWRLSDWSCSATDMIAAELEFLSGIVADHRISSVYDAGCGRGRHLVPMLNAGLEAFGVDISPSNIASAQACLQQYGHDRSLAHVGDISAFQPSVSVDLVISMLSSFGYANDERNFRTLEAMRSSLHPGGLLILDLPNREQMVSHFLQRTWAEVGGYHYLMHYQFDFETGFRDSWLRVITPDGEVRPYFHRVRMHSTVELKGMLHAAGFQLLDVLGDFSNSVTQFDRESRRLQYLAKAL